MTRSVSSRIAAVLVAVAGCSSQASGGDPDGSPARPDAALTPPPDAGPPVMCRITVDCEGMQVPDEPKIDCSMHIDDGRGGVAYDGAIGIELRGRSSLQFPKHQYAVELRTPQGGARPVDLLGMGSDADWVLNGMYIDRALVRNKLFYDLFQSFGGAERYAAESAYCDLTLDGDWLGVYLLVERVKRDASRVVIAKDQEVGASFILKQDVAGFYDIQSANGFWSLIYPNRDDATPAQREGVAAWLDQWESAIAGAPDTDLFELVDLDSAVDFVLLQELAKNNDAFWLSVHVWKDVGGLLHFTPWDLDLSLGQPLYNESTLTSGWIKSRPAMFQAMADDPRFQARLAERWAELRAGVLDAAAIAARIDDDLAIIAPSIADNFVRWPIGSIQFLDDQLPVRSSFDDELASVRAWIPERLSWMDANIAGYVLH